MAGISTCFIVGLAVVLCVGVILFLIFKGIKKGMTWSARLMLIGYMFLLTMLAVINRSVQAERIIDLSPFWSYRAVYDGKNDLLITIIANVLAFVPIGLLLGCAFPRMKWWKVLLIGGGFSVLIETLQFFLKRGFAEFDDVFHNVLGCMIGFGVYALVTYWVKTISSKRLAKSGESD